MYVWLGKVILLRVGFFVLFVCLFVCLFESQRLSGDVPLLPVCAGSSFDD